MSGPDENGRIKLTFPQIAWGISVMVALLAAWFDLRSQVKLVATAVEDHGRRIEAIENRNRYQGFTQQDGQALKDDIIDEIKKRKGK